MKNLWTTAALLSLLLPVGCADRGENNAAPEDKAAPPAAAPAEPGAAPAARPEEAAPAPTEGTRATTSARATRPSTSAPPSAPRSSTSRAEDARPAPRATAATEGNAAPTRRAAEWREVTIPAGTALPLELETALSSETAQIETPVRAKLKQALSVDGYAAIPAGAILSGEVTEVARAGKIKGRSRLAFTFNRLQAENVREDVRTNPLTFEGEASKGEDATKVGAGAVGGAIVGGILGGGGGAAKGAAIGGAAGTGVVLATRGKDVKLSSGTDLAASLAAPLTIRVPLR